MAGSLQVSKQGRFGQWKTDHLGCEIWHTLPAILKTVLRSLLFWFDCHVLIFLANPKLSLVYPTKPVTVADSMGRMGGTFAEGVEVMGLRGCRGLRQALGVTGVRCLDRLLQIRTHDGMRQLSATLVLAKHGAQNY